MKARSQTFSLKHQPSAGFTLVEMLVVVVIIAILMSLLSMAVFSALEQARITRVALEAQTLTQGFQTFATTKGVDFPPTDLRLADPPSDEPLLVYVQRLFPRYDAQTNLYSDLTAEGINLTDFDPGYSLVFWLVGLSGDPANPFSGHAGRMGLGGSPDLEKALYDFDTDRLRDGRYFPPIPGDVDDLNEDNAFLYFDSGYYRGKEDTGAASILPYQGFRPYRKTDPNDMPGGLSAVHYNYESIQIISAGLDKKLGHGTGFNNAAWSILPCGSNAGVRCEDDADNITNFSGGNTVSEFAGE